MGSIEQFDNDKEKQVRRRDLLRWLIGVPLVLLLLLCCGQLALIGIAPPTSADTRSNLRSDYGAWPFTPLPPISTAIVEDILQDQQSFPETFGDGPQPTVVAGELWLTPPGGGPPATVVAIVTATPTPPPPPTATPTFTPRPPTATPTRTPTWTPMATPTRRPTRVILPTATHTPTLIPTDTPTSVPPPTPVPPTNTPAPTSTPMTPPAPPLPPTPLPTNTPTTTSTPTATPTNTPTPTPTATPTPTPTNTAAPCSGTIPGGEPNVGAPNGVVATVACGTSIIVPLGGPLLVKPHLAAVYDLVYYEMEAVPPGGEIALDWVVVDVCTDALCATAYTVFNWGDGDPTNNGQLGSMPESDSAAIPFSSLYGSGPLQTGIAIDVDALPGVPPGVFAWVRIYSPLGGNNDPPQVDAIEVLPP